MHLPGVLLVCLQSNHWFLIMSLYGCWLGFIVWQIGWAEILTLLVLSLASVECTKSFEGEPSFLRVVHLSSLVTNFNCLIKVSCDFARDHLRTLFLPRVSPRSCRFTLIFCLCSVILLWRCKVNTVLESCGRETFILAPLTTSSFWNGIVNPGVGFVTIDTLNCQALCN